MLACDWVSDCCIVEVDDTDVDTHSELDTSPGGVSSAVCVQQPGGNLVSACVAEVSTMRADIGGVPAWLEGVGDA